MKLFSSWGAVVWLAVTACRASARSWRDIQPLHGFDPMQPFDMEELFSAQNPLNTPAPTEPTASPTFPATSKPTAVPTVAPTQMPTSTPTTSPTYPLPTAAPTDTPTGVPDPYPFNPPPDKPDKWYFNYDDRPDALYGPGTYGMVSDGKGGLTAGVKNNAWANVQTPPNSYWNEFSDSGSGPWKGVLANHNPLKNRCDRVGLQSPVDVRHNGLATCTEHHEVRSLVSNFAMATKNTLTDRILTTRFAL